jgi:hypothetical protein
MVELSHKPMWLQPGWLVYTGRYIMFLKARVIAAVKNIDALMLTRVWQELEYCVDVCRVTRGSHIEHL